MVLSLHERRVIADMERSLTQEEPRLSKKLADFGRAHPEPIRPAPPAELPPADPFGDRRARRTTVWSIALALTLMSVALVLAAAGLLAAASASALAGIACWALYRRRRNRGPAGPPGPPRGS